MLIILNNTFYIKNFLYIRLSILTILFVSQESLYIYIYIYIWKGIISGLILLDHDF